MILLPAGIKGQILNWNKDILDNTKQAVVLNSINSDIYIWV